MRVEINRIGGDVYVNGTKIAFAVDFTNPPVNPPVYGNVDWLLGWAKIGLMSHGHPVPHFEVHEFASFRAPAVPAPDTANDKKCESCEQPITEGAYEIESRTLCQPCYFLASGAAIETSAIKQGEPDVDYGTGGGEGSLIK